MCFEDYVSELHENRVITRKTDFIEIFYSPKALDNHIDNRVPEGRLDIWDNIRAVAEVWDDIKVLCHSAKRTSWYRCEKLNTLVGSKKKHHVNGYAIDFVTEDVYRDFDILKKELPKYTRLILEVSKTAKWIHVEFLGNNERVNFRMDA